MSCLHYHGAQLFVEEVSLASIAEQFGTPCYVYSRAKLEANWRAFQTALQTHPHEICYAVKANSNLAILNSLAKMDAGFDIVSIGEAKRVIAAGGNPQKIVFSGVAKTNTEIETAIAMEIHCFNVESIPELERIKQIAAHLQKPVRIALRINPNINAHTHSHITTGLLDNKFGIDANDVIPIAASLKSHSMVQLIGIACHIGSQITELTPFMELVDFLLKMQSKLAAIGIDIKHLNFGGGLGIHYHHEQPPTIHDYAKTILQKCHDKKITLFFEPGRAIVGDAGVLLTRIEYIKSTPHKQFAIVDAGMNDLIRPALYDAWQTILPVSQRDIEKQHYDIAGPVCESADFLGKNRHLAIETNDLLAIDAVGAYGFSMSSNYNSRPRPAEVMVSDTQVKLIRPRETIEALYQSEIVNPF